MPQNLYDLVNQLVVDTKGTAEGLFAFTSDSSIFAFGPELIICATIVLMLLLRIFSRIDMFYVALLGSALALVAAQPLAHLGAEAAAYIPTTVTRMEIFTGMLVYDTFSVYVRALLLLFAVLFVVLTRLSGIPDSEDGPDIYTLALGATLGMCLMASANHLLMVFMAVEMASVPSYVLAGMVKGRRRGSEAALKYSIYGAGAAGVMLYGISLLAGLVNSAHLPTIARVLAESYPTMSGSEIMVLALAGLMIMVGLAFKLSAVPFHFWCPDVFEGATAEVNAFLSVASKAAALALLVRVAVGLGGVAPRGIAMDDIVNQQGQYQVPAEDSIYFQPGVRSEMRAIEQRLQQEAESPPPGEQAAVAGERTVFVAKMQTASEGGTPEEGAAESSNASAGLSAPIPLTRQQAISNLEPVRDFIAKLVALLAIVTCTFGNLAAYGQTNIKRLMAYSTIAHAGYMMMPIPVIMAMLGEHPGVAQSAIAALCIYMFVYLFMNLGVFAVIAFMRNAMQSEEIADYAGLIRRYPDIVVWLSILMFSLVGLPPLAGFIGKFAIFASLADGYRITLAAGDPATYLLLLLVIGGINTAISLFYYLRVVTTMTMQSPREDQLPFELSDPLQRAFVASMGIATIVLFFGWDWVSEWAETAARHVL